MKRTEGVTIRCGLRDAKKWLKGFRGRFVLDSMDKRRRQFQATIAYGYYLDLVERWPEITQHRVYFGDEIDKLVSGRLEAQLAARTSH